MSDYEKRRQENIKKVSATRYCTTRRVTQPPTTEPSAPSFARFRQANTRAKGKESEESARYEKEKGL